MPSGGQHFGRSDTEGKVVYRSENEAEGETPLSTRVLMALDSVPGCDVENSETVVFDHIDLDALDELFRSTTGAARHTTVTFQFEQYDVTVNALGDITVRTD